jgi:uncharacterized protein (TIGR03083 family)
MEFERHCDLIVEQAELLADHLTGQDLRTPVPSCPGWNVGQLVRHVGGAHREATAIAQTGVAPPDDEFRDPTHWYTGPCTDADVRELREWVTAGARELAKVLVEAGPDMPIQMPLENPTTRFTARRMTYETAMHRADAALALNLPYLLETQIAADAIDEWMELGALPFHFEVHPWMRELLGPGRTLKFEASDWKAAWLVDLTGDVIAWRHSDEPAAVTVRGPVTELLLHIYKRRTGSVEVTGDNDLLDYYLERVSFG